MWGSFDGSHAIDGDLNTPVVTLNERNGWVSVQLDVRAGSSVQLVAVYNRPDHYASLLSPFEVWLGASFGDCTSDAARRCGGIQRVPATVGPFIVPCSEAAASTSAAKFVTVRHVGSGYFSFMEVEAYSLPYPPAAPPHPAMPPQPPPPPSPPPSPPSAPMVASPDHRPRPPPAPAPPLESLRPLTRLASRMSSVYASYGASFAMDDDLSTVCVTDNSAHNWVSVKVDVGASAIRYVAVHNRDDRYSYLLSPFEVCIGRSFGDCSSVSSRPCGGAQLVPATAGPFLVACDAVEREDERASGQYVTIRHAGLSTGHFSLAEVMVYASAVPPSPPMTPPPPVGPAPTAPEPQLPPGPTSPVPAPTPPEPPVPPPSPALPPPPIEPPGLCEAWCAMHPRYWSIKCTGFHACLGCPECFVPPPLPPVQPSPTPPAAPQPPGLPVPPVPPSHSPDQPPPCVAQPPQPASPQAPLNSLLPTQSPLEAGGAAVLIAAGLLLIGFVVHCTCRPTESAQRHKAWTGEEGGDGRTTATKRAPSSSRSSRSRLRADGRAPRSDAPCWVSDAAPAEGGGGRTSTRPARGGVGAPQFVELATASPSPAIAAVARLRETLD